MKASIQRIGPGGEKDYYNVTIDGLQMGVFKYSSDKNEWRFAASAGSKTMHQHKAIFDVWKTLEPVISLSLMDGCEMPAETNKPVKGY